MDNFKYQELVAGMAAGLTQDALLHPLDTLRARLDTGVSSATARSAVVRPGGSSRAQACDG